MKTKRRPPWKLIVGILILCFCLEEGIVLSTPKIANYFGMAWSGGLPDHVSYAGKTYTQPSVCLAEDQIKQLALTQVDSIPSLFGTARPLLLPGAQIHSKNTATTAYIETEAGCYVDYELADNSFRERTINEEVTWWKRQGSSYKHLTAWVKTQQLAAG